MIKKAVKEESKTLEYEVEVLKCKEVNGNYVLDLYVNRVTIYGCWYRTYKDKKTGEEKGFVAMPSHKATYNGEEKYFNYAFFPITEKPLQILKSK